MNQTLLKNVSYLNVNSAVSVTTRGQPRKKGMMLGLCLTGIQLVKGACCVDHSVLAPFVPSVPIVARNL